MIDTLMQYVAPHHCFSCGKIGGFVCQRCKQYIEKPSKNSCSQCGRELRGGQCKTCLLPYEKQYFATEYDRIVTAISAYKLEAKRAGAPVLAEIVTRALPKLPDNAVVTYIPTSTAHIRERGFDHAKLLARSVARQSGAKFECAFRRRTNATQRGKGRREREEQARDAFELLRTPQPNTTYIIVDDVVTTGATMRAAASLLREVGVKHVWIAALTQKENTPDGVV